MEFVNCTPHKIVVRTASGDVEFPPSGSVARVSSRTEEVPGGTVPLARVSFGEVDGLPEPSEGVMYITSLLVRTASGRADVCSPDTGPDAIRENGQVVAVKRFIVN